MQHEQKKRWGNNTPKDIFHIPSILSSYPNAKVVMCVRDIRDFLLSYSASQADICRVSGASRISVKRSVKLYREKGMACFFEEPKRRSPAVLTPEVIVQVQELLDDDQSIPEIARELGLKADTLRKAVQESRLHKPQKKTKTLTVASC